MWDHAPVRNWTPSDVRQWVTTLDRHVRGAVYYGAVLEHRGVDGHQLKTANILKMMQHMWSRGRGGRFQLVCRCAVAAVQIRNHLWTHMHSESWGRTMTLAQKQMKLASETEKIDNAAAPEVVLTMKQQVRNEVFFARCVHNVPRLVFAEKAKARTEVQDTLMSHGVLTVLLRGMRRYAFGPRVQRKGCSALAALAWKHQPIKEQILRAGGVDCVLHALLRYERVERIQKAGCHALQAFCKEYQAAQDHVAAVAGVRLAQDPRGAYLNWFSHGWPTVCASDSMKASIQMSAEDDGTVYSTRVAEDSERRPHLFKSKLHGVQNAAASFREQARKGDGVDGEACRASVQNATSEVAVVGNQACRSIALLAAANQQQQALLGVCGGIAALTTSLENRVADAERQEVGCFALSTVCSWTVRSETQDKVTKSTVDAVVAGMLHHRHDERVQEEAMCALISIAKRHKKNTDLVLASDASQNAKLRIRELATEAPT